MGSYLGHAVSKPSELVPLCVVMSLADLFSVFKGPTAVMSGNINAYYQKGAVGFPPLVDFILMKGAVPGYPSPAPLFGVSDWVVAVFFFHAVQKFNLSDSIIKQNIKQSIYLPAGVFGLCIAVVSARISGLFIPALPVMAVCFMLVVLTKNPVVRELTKKEWRLIAGSVVVMGVLMFVVSKI